MFPDLYLMRHGQTEWNAEGRMQGRLDSPLTALGRAQAARQAELVAGIDAARISSPQGRARQSAEIIFAKQGFETDARLVEIDIGDFTGWLGPDLRREHPDLFRAGRLDWYDRAPGGEHFAGLMARAKCFLDALPGSALIVTHGITLRMLRLLALGWPVGRLEDLTVEQGAVHVVRDGQYKVWR